jgi:hypothetical protein
VSHKTAPRTPPKQFAHLSDASGLGLALPGFGPDAPGLGLEVSGLSPDAPGLGLEVPGRGLGGSGLGLGAAGIGRVAPGFGLVVSGLGLGIAGFGLAGRGVGMLGSGEGPKTEISSSKESGGIGSEAEMGKRGSRSEARGAEGPRAVRGREGREGGERGDRGGCRLGLCAYLEPKNFAFRTWPLRSLAPRVRLATSERWVLRIAAGADIRHEIEHLGLSQNIEQPLRHHRQFGGPARRDVFL